MKFSTSLFLLVRAQPCKWMRLWLMTYLLSNTAHQSMLGQAGRASTMGRNVRPVGQFLQSKSVFRLYQRTAGIPHHVCGIWMPLPDKAYAVSHSHLTQERQTNHHLTAVCKPARQEAAGNLSAVLHLFGVIFQCSRHKSLIARRRHFHCETCKTGCLPVRSTREPCASAQTANSRHRKLPEDAPHHTSPLS